MEETIVDTVYNENKDVLEYLAAKQEVSFQQDMDNKLKKILLVSAASFFETKVTELLIRFFGLKTNNNDEILSFLKKKALDRQYHSLFVWDANNINKFLGWFGEDFKKQAIEEIKEQELESEAKSFLRLGDLRNQLVHKNMATFFIDLTSEEIYDLYKQALRLIDYLERKLV